MDDPTPKTSFSAGRRWGIFFSVIISIMAVIALVIMINYLGARYYARLTLSTQTRQQLSPQTISLIKSITNEVNVVIYYDKKDDLYGDIVTLLDEYRLRNPKISVQTIDYRADAAAALKIKEKYKESFGLTGGKNLVIFECNGKPFIVPGEILGHYTLTPADVPETASNGKTQTERSFDKNLTYFQGETSFSAALLAVTSSKPLTAYFIEGHGEHPSGDDKDEPGYGRFKAVLAVNFIQSGVITNLLGTNTIPADCNLLIIAGVRKRYPIEWEKVRDYLNHGGKLFVLFNFITKDNDTGLEAILADWGVEVGGNVIKDVNHSSEPSGDDLLVGSFSSSHPLVNPLLGSSLQLVRPRSVGASTNKPGSDTPKVENLAFADETAKINDSPLPAGRQIPLVVAVEKAGSKGVFPEHGTTRIVVAGDSFFLDNHMIDGADNRAFASYAINWLLDRKQLLAGVGPHPVIEYKLMMTRAQLSSVRWIFLAAMPGAFLLFGGLVWLRRRH
jgi:ABC-2 type transport system permease protein